MLGYTVWGNGPHKIIVLHDWLGDHQNYKTMQPYMDIDAFQYAFVDLRGYGKSKDQTGSFTAAQSAQDVLEVADQLGWQSFHIIGHSMTGQVGLKIISQTDERVFSYVAITPVPASSAHMPPEMVAGMKQALETREGRQQMLSMMWSPRLNEKWKDFKLDHWMAESTTKAAQGYLDMFASEDFSAEVPNTATPMLVIACEDDMVGFKPEDIQRGFGHYTNAEIVTIHDSGHYPMQETPVYLASLIDCFLKRQVGLATSQGDVA